MAQEINAIQDIGSGDITMLKIHSRGYWYQNVLTFNDFPQMLSTRISRVSAFRLKEFECAYRNGIFTIKKHFVIY
jgi:hypothetical protein